MSRKISQVGIRLIQNFESCRLTAYKAVPTEQYWTIGWGHYGADVKPGSTITQEKADSMFATDLEKYVAYVNNPSYVPLTDKLNQNQFDALVSFCYNCGAGSLRMLCRDRTIAQIAENITKYNKSGGKMLTGLVRRRKAELELFNKAVVVNKPVVYPVIQGEADITVNNKDVPQGYIINGLTYVPIRAVTELLGATVSWDEDAKSVTVKGK